STMPREQLLDDCEQFWSASAAKLYRIGKTSVKRALTAFTSRTTPARNSSTVHAAMVSSLSAIATRPCASVCRRN
ncbi:hypothetical protein, partial [Pseudomonas viridiflava]|uniref:hypothetical protein n=1 Tax=Pseudomonas viridiflava TaxID=33069 RepID=UPI001F12053C